MKMQFLPYNNDHLLTNFPPLLRKNFEELLTNGKIGLSAFTVHDISFTKQYTENSENASSYSYHYAIKIPFAGKKLTWEIIFNPEDMSFAPDFNFNDDTFVMSQDLDMVIESVPSLLNWNVNNPKSLVTVLVEFLSLFKKQQLEKLHQENIYAHLSAEYVVLIENISPNDVEVYLENTGAHFLINVTVDVSSLPEYIQPKENGQDCLINPGEDNCILKVSYLKLDGTRINSQLQLPPRLEQVLGGGKSFHIPTLTKQTLSEYVTIVTKLLKDQIERVEQNHKLKKEFMNSLCAMYGQTLITFDSENYADAEILYEVDGYHCLVHIEIGPNFPKEKPLVTLHSLYCMLFKKPCSEVIEDYPYSPRWAPEQMLKKLAFFLVEAILKFKNHKH